MDVNLWNGNFQSISLHGSLEHLPSDSKCIKESLIWIAKYINNKSIDVNKFNDVDELKEIGQAVWKFVSSIYNSEWDLLFVDENKNLFRQIVANKFTFKTNSVKIGKKEEKMLQP